MPYLYILKLQDNTSYCGITMDIGKRMLDHLHGTNKYTCTRLPFVIKYIKEYESMRMARKMEKKIKLQGVTRWYIKNKFDKENLFTQQPTANSPCLVPRQFGS